MRQRCTGSAFALILLALGLTGSQSIAASANVEDLRQALTDATSAPGQMELFCSFLRTFDNDPVDDAEAHELDQRRQFLVAAMGSAFASAWQLSTRIPASDAEDLEDVLSSFDQTCSIHAQAH